MGSVFATTASLKLWHERMRHMPKAALLKMHESGAVQGFKLKGKHNLSCSCDVCAQAKIRRAATPRVREYEDLAKRIGDRVSTDVKSLPHTSFNGYRYCIVFIDHATRFSLVYFMRKKSETTAMLRRYLADMASLGIVVRCVQSDRGSEYFAQEGATYVDRDRAVHSFDQVCASQQPPIRHILRPIEMKEKLAEAYFKEHFSACNAMLWAGRLSPCFWADCIAYSNYLWNRCGNSHIGYKTTPWTIATGEIPRWDKVKVFGCQCFEHIPNNQYYKVPGVPRGRNLIFVGFDRNMDGWKCFDPETRRYFSTANLYFHEDFSARVDSLRHHDRRRAILRAKEEQPIIIDDFDDPNADAIRGLYLDPDATLPPLPTALQVEGATLPPQATEPPLGGAELPDEATEPPLGGAPAEEPLTPTPPVKLRGVPTPARVPGPHHGPLTQQAVAADNVRNLLREGVVLRPLRLEPVGAISYFSPDDVAFLQHARVHSYPVKFISPCPYRDVSQQARRYRRYMHATTLTEAFELGAQDHDIRQCYTKGYISFPRHEPDIPGHIFNAFSLAEDQGFVHALHVARLGVRKTFEADIKLAKVFHSSSAATFQSALETVFEPEVIVEQLATRESQLRFSSESFAKVLNSNTINIDFTLSPEPTKYADVLPDVCVEHSDWRAAMDDEMKSMERFGVYRRVPRSAAKGRQVLGTRWVYKRKVNRFGVVNRYRARLVAQGFRQKAFDSYHPDETFSPVVHKDTLRLFLSLCAAENLSIYQADVKAAFLQAPLKEKIYVRAPPGYSSYSAAGEEEVLELSKAIYGLKQSSACFWEAMRDHLLRQGYQSILGDPCLFRKIMPDGSMVLTCTYIDDVTYGVSSPALADSFLAMLRERFVIEEGEGQPIDYLLGMAVTQDLTAGTVRIDMEMAITKLCCGILTKEELAKSVTVDTPMLAQPLKKEVVNVVPKSDFDYLSVVGSLLHITNCLRCDVAFAVGCLARFASAPGPQHVRACKRVLKYLYSTRNLGIRYTRYSKHKNEPMMYAGAKHPLDNGTNLLQIFADSDYAADETRRSTMGTITIMNGGPIAWSSVLGKTVAMSTCEAEVNAAVSAAKDALHLKGMLVEMGYASPDAPLQIGEDNSACIAQAESGLRHVRNAKHYEIRLRFLQQLVVDQKVKFIYTPTDLQLADWLTKPLDSSKFVAFRDMVLFPPA
mgnify:FL=1